MSTRWGRRLQCAAACLLLVAYAGLSHYCNAVDARPLGAALALAPLTLVALIMAWRRARPLIALVALACGAGLYAVWPFLQQHFSLFYFVQEGSIYGLLGATFGRSLMPGRVALCTELADRVHGPLTARDVAYTRQVTLAWAIFFFAIATVSIFLYVAAPLRVWSIYINFCVLPLIGTMFLIEYGIRRRVLPRGTRAGLLASVRVYFASSS